MLHLQKRTYAILLIVLLVVGGALFVLLGLLKKPAPIPAPPEPVTQTPTSTAQLPWHTMTVIGASVEGRPIEAHTFGNGSTSLLFVGGIHGGYEWNSVLLAYEVMDYLATYPETVPSDLTIYVIPSLNPDGLSKVVSTTGRFTLDDVPTPSERVAAARFNANNVDLNRNFDCKWQPTSTWQGKSVSAGAAAFSEPEAIALRDYVLKTAPQAVLFWHSQANNVYASECENGVLPQTVTLMSTYATAAGYGAVASFDAYPVTGDAEGWLASMGIPAVTVEFGSHESSEWAKNLAGTQAVIRLYSQIQ